VLRGVPLLLIALAFMGSPAMSQEAEAPAARGLATVESLALEVIEGFPVEVQATVGGTLPDACTAIDLIEQVTVDSERRIGLVLETERDPAVICASVLTRFNVALPLVVGSLASGAYRVDAGEASEEFELPGFDDLGFAPLPRVAESRRIFLPRVGLTFDAPGGWSRKGLEWESPPYLASRMGVRGHPLSEGEAEQWLPAASIMHESSEARFGWTMGVRFRVSRDEGRLWSEHVFVRCEGEQLCELWLRGPSEPLLEAATESFWRLVRFVARYDPS
jgi:hypothetical protein